MTASVDVLARLLDEMGNLQANDEGDLFTAHGQAAWLLARGVAVARGAFPAGPQDANDGPIYVAASWRTPRQQEVVSVLRTAGLPVYDFRNPAPGDNGFAWSEIDEGWQSWTAEQFVGALKSPIAQRGFATDMNALRRARSVILVQPSGRSAALEFGWARGAGKPGAVLLAEGQEPELMLGMADLLTPSLDEIVAWAKAARVPAGRVSLVTSPPPRLIQSATLPDPGPGWVEVSTKEDRAVGLRIYIPTD